VEKHYLRFKWGSHCLLKYYYRTDSDNSGEPKVQASRRQRFRGGPNSRTVRQREESVERRTFLAAASVGSLAGGPLARLANAQRGSSSAAKSSGSASFKTAEIDVAGNKVFYRLYGQGPAILMVHGFPRTSLMWRFLAPKLAGNHTVVCVDLRGYGRSGYPLRQTTTFLIPNAQWQRNWLMQWSNSAFQRLR
jgi:alpha/beta hydrolase fold